MHRVTSYKKFLTKRKHKEQSELKNIRTETKNTLEGINSRINEAEGQISELEDRVVEITAMEQNNEKTQRNEDSLRDFWDNVKHQHSHYSGPRRRRETDSV